MGDRGGGGSGGWGGDWSRGLFTHSASSVAPAERRGAAAVFGWFFSGVRGCSGLFGGGPIWSECSAVFSFVRLCSGLFGGVPAWMVWLGGRSGLAGGEVGIVRTFVLLWGYRSTMGAMWRSGRARLGRQVVASHPPPNLPPSRGEGLNWGWVGAGVGLGSGEGWIGEALSRGKLG